jgi:hypothetical protein
LTALSEHVCVTVWPALAEDHDDLVRTRSPISWAFAPPSPPRLRRQCLDARLSGAAVAGGRGDGGRQCRQQRQQRQQGAEEREVFYR